MDFLNSFAVVRTRHASHNALVSVDEVQRLERESSIETNQSLTRLFQLLSRHGFNRNRLYGETLSIEPADHFKQTKELLTELLIANGRACRLRSSTTKHINPY